jgi:hypothetical protein
MQKKRAVVVASFAALLSGVASNAWSAEFWTPVTRITTLYPASGALHLLTEYGNTTLSACDSGRRWTIDATHDNYNVLSAAMMAAFMAGKQVQLNITVASPTPCGGTINRFMVVE